MQSKVKNYFYLILVHLILGVGIFAVPFLSKIYGLLILVIGCYYIIKSTNKNNEALYAASYLVGAEVFLRMTDGVFLYEFGKYGVMLFMFIGMLYSGTSKKAIPYWLFLFLLVPGVVIATQTLNIDTDIRKRILFNLSGPLCLGIASLYTFDRKLSLNQLNDLLLAIGLPIVSCVIYLFFYVPDLKLVLKGTGSNFTTSGGFGPNQVATILGLGMFVFFSRALLCSRTLLMVCFNLGVAALIGYRGLVTFSRGGMITGIVMLGILVFFLYVNSKANGKFKLGFLMGVSFMLFVGVWLYAGLQTGGLIGKRYANQDALGRQKESQLSGRENIAISEIDAFLENPLLGIGVAKAKEYRMEETGEEVASHSEITRMLAEHGALGIIGLLILIFTPILIYFDNKQNVYLFCFLFFWLLTINHAAMRIAASAFVYSLSLLKIQFDDQPSALSGK